MSKVTQKRLRFIAGPNGSGKSTIFKQLSKNFHTGPFVNADEIQIALYNHRQLDLRKTFNIETSAKLFQQFLTEEGERWKQKAAIEKIEITLKELNLEDILFPKKKSLVDTPNPLN